MSLGVSPLSVRTLLFINLGIGLLVSLANGAALTIALNGNAAQLAGKELEITLWLSMGLMLFTASIISIARRRTEMIILRFQTTIIALLATLLAAWGLTLIFENFPDSKTIWSLGYLSGVAIYTMYLASRSFSDTKLHAQLFFLKAIFLSICIAVDFLVFLRVGGTI